MRKLQKLGTGWKLVLGVAAYMAVFYGAVLGQGAVFGALFAAWGLTDANLAYAPAWARWIVYGHTDFTYGLAYALSMAAALKLGKRWSEPVKSDPGKAGFGALGGLALGALLTAVAFIFDSMRLERPLTEPHFGAAQLSALAVLVLGGLSGEALTKRIVFDPIRRRLGRPAGYAAACMMSVLLCGRWINPLGLLNALLLGLVGCALYERGGLWASAALQVGWGAWTTLLFAWPNSGAVSVYRMYTVSEAWLTGGNTGADYGFGVTIGWIIMAAVLLRKDAKRRFAVKKKERITNE